MKSIEEEVLEDEIVSDGFESPRNRIFKTIKLTQQIQKQRILKILEDRKELLEDLKKKPDIERIRPESEFRIIGIHELDEKLEEINKLIKEIEGLK